MNLKTRTASSRAVAWGERTHNARRYATLPGRRARSARRVQARPRAAWCCVVRTTDDARCAHKPHNAHRHACRAAAVSGHVFGDALCWSESTSGEPGAACAKADAVYRRGEEQTAIHHFAGLFVCSVLARFFDARCSILVRWLSDKYSPIDLLRSIDC